jgi:hypothetical protein
MSAEGLSFLGGGSDDGTKTKLGFLGSDFQIEDFFVCVETDDSLEMRGLRQGAYVVFELHKNDGVREPRNVRLAIDDEIVAYMPRCEPSVNSVKNTDFDMLGGLGVEVQARRGLPQK